MKHLRRPVIGVGTFLGILLATGAACAVVWDKKNLPPPNPPPAVPAALASKVKLELVTKDTTEVTAMVAAPEPPGRIFVVEKRGPIRILRGKKFDAKPFFDLTGKVSLWTKPNGEQGLLGLAFHPQFQKNGKLYINYTDLKGTTQVVELKVDSKDPNRADPASARTLMSVEQPFDNHNGGDVQFGPDGKLYVLLGDGGKADDPLGHGQNPKTPLSKIWRIDVDAAKPVTEMLGKGMRNPWRYSFDRKTGDLYIADVGQNVWEYVHVIPAAKVGKPGHNLGWNIIEGSNCFKKETCDKKGITSFPVVEYPHSEGCSITGGHVYRGKALPELDGHYFYSDYCTALVRSFKLKDGKASEHFDWKAALDPESQLAKVSTFGQDQDGELYLVTHEGPIFKFVRR
jgi:glucose/arabinose dehydrogenase